MSILKKNIASNFSSSFYITCLFQFQLCYFLQRLFFGLGLGLEDAGLGLGLGTAGLSLGLEGAGLGLGLGLETTGLALGLGTLVLTTRLVYCRVICFFSGLITAIVLCRENAISHWRAMMGNTKVYRLHNLYLIYYLIKIFQFVSTSILVICWLRMYLIPDMVWQIWYPAGAS